MRSRLPKELNTFFAGSEYGYQWWRRKKVIGDSIINLFYAAGHGGQFIFCCPSLDLVAVFTSKVYSNPLGVVRPQVIMAEHILPAMIPLSKSEKKIVLEPELTNAFIGMYECSVCLFIWFKNCRHFFFDLHIFADFLGTGL